MPQLSTRMRTSPGPISGTGMDSTATTLAPLYTAACIVERAGAAVTSLESAVGKKNSQGDGGPAAVPVEFHQLWHYREGPRYGGERNPGPREIPARITIAIEIQGQRVSRPVRHRTNT